MNAETKAKNLSEQKLFYGWWIVCVSTLALLVSNGLTIGGIPVFYKPMLNDLIASGATTAQNAPNVVGIAASLTFLVAGLFSPVGGALLQKFSTRKIMLAGCVILGSALLLYSRAVSTTHIFAAHTMFGVSLGLVGVLPNTVLISNWFRRRRGTALGIVITGTSFGGVLIPLISTPLIYGYSGYPSLSFREFTIQLLIFLSIPSYGWRTSVLIVSLLVWFILLPAVLLIVRDTPGERGLLPDGEASPVETSTHTSQLSGMTLTEALQTPIFWIFGLAAAAIFYPIFTTSQQFILYLQTPRIGMTPQEASFAQAALFISSVGGKFFFGWLSDKFSTARVMAFCCLLMLLGTLFLFGLTKQTVFFFLIPFGMGYGGTFVLIQLLAAETFGLREIGKILGSIIVIETIGGALGTFVTGKLASNANGDYSVAFNYVVFATAFALLMILILSFMSRKQMKSE